MTVFQKELDQLRELNRKFGSSSKISLKSELKKTKKIPKVTMKELVHASPERKPPAKLSGIRVDPSLIAEVINFVLPGSSIDQTLPSLCCVLLETSNNKLMATSTDGQVLMHIEVPCSFKFPTGEILIHKDDCSRIVNTFTLHAPKIAGTLTVSSNTYELKYGSESVKFKADEHGFPPWRQVIPDSSWVTPVKIVLSRAQLLGIVKNAPADPNRYDKLKTILFVFTGDELLIASRLPGGIADAVNFEDPRPLAILNRRMSCQRQSSVLVAVNGNHLKQIIKPLYDDNLTFEIGEEFDPIVIRSSGSSSSALCVLMPTKIDQQKSVDEWIAHILFEVKR